MYLFQLWFFPAVRGFVAECRIKIWKSWRNSNILMLGTIKASKQFWNFFMHIPQYPLYKVLSRQRAVAAAASIVCNANATVQGYLPLLSEEKFPQCLTMWPWQPQKPHRGKRKKTKKELILQVQVPWVRAILSFKFNYLVWDDKYFF